jgi:hypothetical protein
MTNPPPSAPPSERLAQAVQAAETALIEFEIAVETFRIEVANFSRLHEQRLGPLHARLDELDARIAEAVAARSGDPADQRRAKEARERATPLPSITDLFGEEPSDPSEPSEPAAPPPPTPPKVRPSPETRKLYRDLVRLAHPDLATDEPERTRRDAFIARVNAAYADGDTEALRALAAEWQETGGEPRRPGVTELTARLEWLAARKERLTEEAAALEASAIGAMLRMAPDDPDRLLDEIAADLMRTLAAREAELATLLSTGSGSGSGPQ